MTENPNGPRPKRLYQPPLPWNGHPGLEPARSGRTKGTTRAPMATKGNRVAAESRRSDGPRPPRRAVAYGDWRLDEKTRQAGRQGVAAARAALAGAVRPGERRRADAA